MSRSSHNIQLALYVALICYGSLYPLSGWRLPHDYAATVLGFRWPHHVGLSDLVTNLIIYLPVGFLGVRALRGRVEGFGAVFVVTVLATGLSFMLECTQMFLPDRESSLSDLVLNGISGWTGAWLASLDWREGLPGERLRLVRLTWFFHGRGADLCLAAVAFWALAQLAPFVPSLDVGKLRHGLSPLWRTLQGTVPLRVPVLAVYALQITGLAGLALLAAAERFRALTLLAGAVAAVLLLKIPIMGRELSLEAAAGFGVALMLFPLYARLPRRVVQATALASVFGAFVIDELRPAYDGAVQILYPFNWVPFRGQMANLMGFAGILEALWPFLALSALCQATPGPKRRSFAAAGGVLAVVVAATLEWQQQFIPGRYPDLTAVLLAGLGWTLPWLWRRELPSLEAPTPVSLEGTASRWRSETINTKRSRL